MLWLSLLCPLNAKIARLLFRKWHKTVPVFWGNEGIVVARLMSIDIFVICPAGRRNWYNDYIKAGSARRGQNIICKVKKTDIVKQHYEKSTDTAIPIFRTSKVNEKRVREIDVFNCLRKENHLLQLTYREFQKIGGSRNRDSTVSKIMSLSEHVSKYAE